MKLKKDLKFWIYHNLKSFYKSDPYFKNFPTDVILGNLKGVLIRAENLKDLLQMLKGQDIDKPFKLFRKMDGDVPLYFKYPSISFQIESLVSCWTEIKSIEKQIKISNGIEVKKDPSVNLFSNDDESFSDDQSSSFLFGLRPNLINFLGIEDEENETLYAHEISKVGAIRSDFKTEYEAFKKSIRLKTIDVAREEGVGIFFQTDIKKFYHSISPEMAITFLNENFPQAINVIQCLEKLKAEKEDELPIGWILSGTVAYLILSRFHEILKKNLKSVVIDLKNPNLKNAKIEIISYVDDFIFIIKSKKLLNSDEKKILELAILECSEAVFQNILGQKVVLFHRTTAGGKNKTFDITPAFADIVDSNFFDFITDASARDADDLDIFEELMLPGDNNLIINERVQFLKSLSSSKGKMDEIAKGSITVFNNIFKKVIYKIDTDGLKYIQPIMSFLGTYFDELKIHGNYKSSIFNDKIQAIEERIFSIKNPSVDLLIKYTLSFKKLITKDNLEELDLFIQSFKKCKLAIRNNPHCGGADLSLIEMLSEQIRSEFLRGGIRSVDFKIQNNDTELPFFKSYQKYTDLISTVKGNIQNSLTLNNEDVFLAIEAMKNVYFLLDNIKKEDFLIKSIKKIIPQAVNKNDFFDLIIKEGMYLFLSSLTASGRSSFLRSIKTYSNNYDPVFQEIIYQLENIELVTELVEIRTNQKMKNYCETLQCMAGSSTSINQLSTMSVFTSEFMESKNYLIQNVIFLSYSMNCHNIDDFWRILFFRYTTIDSSFNLSWKGLSSTFSPASLQVGGVLKSFLKIRHSKKTSVLKYALKEIVAQIPKTKEDLDDVVTDIKFDDYMSEFNMEHFFDQSEIKITIVSLPVNPDKKSPNCDYLYEQGAIFKESSIKALHSRILRAIRHAKNEQSDIIIFPELSIPRKYLDYYLREAGDNKMIFIGGLEYSINGVKEARNEIVISLPTHRKKCLTGKSYWPISQLKFYPSTDEFNELKSFGYTFKKGHELIIFKSKYWKNFSILNCVDFFSLKLKQRLQGEIQTLFVPALNYDSTTFNHLAQTCVRELFTFCVICNSQTTGVSSVIAPFRDNNKRTVFSREGMAIPEFSTVMITPAEIDFAQSFDATTAFKKRDDLKKFKQLPPDWKKVG